MDEGEREGVRGGEGVSDVRECVIRRALGVWLCYRGVGLWYGVFGCVGTLYIRECGQMTVLLWGIPQSLLPLTPGLINELAVLPSQLSAIGGLPALVHTLTLHLHIIISTFTIHHRFSSLQTLDSVYSGRDRQCSLTSKTLLGSEAGTRD